jgi:hypothetical protein
VRVGSASGDRSALKRPEQPVRAARLGEQLHEDYPGRDLATYPEDCNLASVASASTFALVDQCAAEIRWKALVKPAGFKRRSPY